MPPTSVAPGRTWVPTERELLGIKAALILQRNATRDSLDFAALADRLGPDTTVSALGPALEAWGRLVTSADVT